MKKQLVLTIVMCMIAGFSFGQKKAIKDAKSEANADKPNFKEARNLIQAAMKDPETKDLAETWYTAGWIEDKQFDDENKKIVIRKKPNEKVMYTALLKVLPYLEKADELDQMPDAKGKAKPKFRKNIKAILRANYPYLTSGGVYYYNAKDYKQAYEFFHQYVITPDLKMFEDDPLISKTDTNYLKYKYYAGNSAFYMKDYQKAIGIYNEMKNVYNSKEMYKYLADSYKLLKDTVNFMSVLKDGIGKYPEDSYFLLNLINQYIFTNKKDEAIEYLNKAIAQNPNNAQLYNVMGSIYEEKKESAKAKEYFDKAMSLNPESAEIQANIGRIYFNKGVELRAVANDISDNKKYAEALAISNAKFKEAMPYFEKAHQLNPNEKEYLVALKGIYYNLGMGKQYEEADAKLKALTPKE